MYREMISGPDLGAGYLHQLSLDRGDEPSFTYHAQEGGLDANGPPKGPLSPIGFVHPTSPCQFGGAHCWHRQFFLPPLAAAGVRAAYNRHRFVLQITLDQLYSNVSIPIATTLRELIELLDAPPAAERIPYYLMGSVADWIQGASVNPRDISIGTVEVGVAQIGEWLKQYLIEPVARTEWPSVGSLVGGRAFLGSLTSGMRIEWAGPRASELESTLLSEIDSRWTDLSPLETVEFEGRQIRVSRMEFSLVRSAIGSDWDRLNRVGQRLREKGPSHRLVDYLVDESQLPQEARQRVSDALRSGGIR
jgi:hypothetical protein